MRRRSSGFKFSLPAVTLPVTPSLVVGVAALTACLVLGGGTRSGFLADFVLQLACVPLLLVVIWCWRPWGSQAADGNHVRIALTFAGALVLLPLLQLIPVPPAVWENLPGRQPVVLTYSLLERELPWRPLSLTPRDTWLALLSLLPSLVVLLATLQMGHAQRRVAGMVIVGIAVVSVFVGLLQLAQGPNSPLRPFTLTNRMDAVGFFANRNHFSALLYAAFLLSVPAALIAARELKAAFDAQRYPTATISLVVVTFTSVAVLIAGQATSRSRAGIALALLAIVCAVAVPFTTEAGRRALLGTRALLMTVLVAAVAFAQLASFRAVERFDMDLTADARLPIAQNTTRAARDHFPVGAGIGSFVSVYDAYERASDVHETFANRAHNDFLEAWLEAGLVGVLLLAAFVVWIGLRTWAAFGARTEDMDWYDRMLMRAAALAVLLLLIHSLVDYPLRTGAMGAVMAFCCGLLVPPPQREERLLMTVAHAAPEPPPRRRSRSTRRLPSAPAPAPAHAMKPPALDPSWSWSPGQAQHGAIAASPTAAQSSPAPTASSAPYPKPPPLPAAAGPGGTPPGETWVGEAQWPEAWQAHAAPGKRPRRPNGSGT